MDQWGVDVAVAACQKGLMTPAGLAFTFHNEKAFAARRRKARVSLYWDWIPRCGKVPLSPVPSLYVPYSTPSQSALALSLLRSLSHFSTS